MIDWEILYKKFGRNKSAEKFEDMALEYARKYYSEYTWKPTGRTRDGNRDFHNLENELLNIWGEAKYKKKCTRLTKRDLDPTILSGLINGKVELIIFVTNGYIPDSLIDRMYLGAKMKGIKLSFVLEAQLSNWLTLNSERYYHYFDEKLDSSVISNEQLIEIRKVSFFEPISLDFHPNYRKINMNVGDTFILNCSIFATQASEGQLCLEIDSPFSIMRNEYYDNPNKFEIKPGLNIISFMIKAKSVYNNTVNIELKTENKSYFYVTEKILIKRNNHLNIVYYKQLDIMWKIKGLIDDFDYTIGNYFISIYGNSGMGKSYILNNISHNYCLDNDITLVTFEKNTDSNINYLLLCRIIIFIQYGNLFWDYSLSNLKKFCITYNAQNNFDTKILDDILNGCFDANVARTTITSLTNKRKPPIFINSKKHKHFRILLLDDIQFLAGSQSKFLKILIKQQLHSENNNIFIFSSRKNEFRDTSLEKLLSDNISNKFELNNLSDKDIKGTLIETFELKEKDISKTIIRELPTNLLILNEILSNCRRLFETKAEISSTELLDYYIKLFDNELIFQEKFKDLKEQYYLLDIIYFFRKGISSRILYQYAPFKHFDLNDDLRKLEENNCIKIIGKNIIFPFHDYLIENYKKLRGGKEFNKKTGDFFKYLLELNTQNFDTNFLLSIICKCGKKFFNYYNKRIQELMLKYINSSQYGTAIVFAELFYNNISQKSELTKKEKYYVYLYADCFVHCDNKYRATEFLQKITDNESMGSFEKYEAQVSLLNQKFWSMNLEGIIEDSKMYQWDLETMFMNNLTKDMLGRFRKAYEACFNRRMVTFLLQDEFKAAQRTYQDGLCGLKKFSDLYGLNYDAEIATIVMDYARGNMARKPKLSYNLFNTATKIFEKYKDTYVRRYLICQIDGLVNINIIGFIPDYTYFKTIIEQLKDNNFVAEHIKAVMKYGACKIIDYSRVNNSLDINKNKFILSSSFSQEIIEMIEACRMENYIVLQNREKFLYNNLMAYLYASQKEIELAKTCLLDNLKYVGDAGESYKKPLVHNLNNIETIQYVEWFQLGKKYSENVYVLESRFW